MIDMDEIRKAVAIKHDVLLGNDDPLLMNVTINESLLQQCLFDMNAHQEANVKALINSIQKSHEETKRLAKKVVDEGTEYACDQISTAIKATMDESRDEFKQQMRKAWEVMQIAKRTAVIGAAVSASCAVVMLGATLSYVF